MILLYLALAYFGGIAMGHWLWQMSMIDCDFPTWLWIAPMGALPLLLWWDRTRVVATSSDLRWPRSAGFESPRPDVTSLILIAVGLSTAAGILRYASHPVSPCWTVSDLAFYNTAQDDRAAPTLTLIGSVRSYPILKEGRQRLQVEVESLVQDGATRPVSGRVQISTGALPRYTYGQRMEIRGQLVDPPVFDKFDYRAYLARKGVHSLLQRPRIDLLPGDDGNPLLGGIYTLRARGEALLNRLLPEPYAALANGMLLGIESGIPDDLYEQFNLTGTSHVIVISGWNATQKW